MTTTSVAEQELMGYRTTPKSSHVQNLILYTLYNTLLMTTIFSFSRKKIAAKENDR